MRQRTTTQPALSQCSARCIELEGQRIDYRIRISPLAKRCKIRVSLDGVEVVLPRRVSLKRAVSMLREHSTWVVRQVEYQQHRMAAGAALLPANTILLRGEPTAVEIIRTTSAGGLAQVEHRDGRWRVRLLVNAETDPAKALETWLRHQAKQDIEARLAHRSVEMRQQPRCIYIRDQRTRWGACSRLGNLSFNWRLVMAPPAVLDYVVVHELAHLAEPNHSPRFWLLVATFCPEFKRHKAWLKEHYAILHRHAMRVF
ncbi:MAG: SprT family zinc-dependent metalloprotease [Candidatus Competibacteraceae bacterium]